MVTKPGKLTLAYTAKMMEYIEAADEYMNLKIDAQSTTGDDPEAKRRVHAWAAKSKAHCKVLVSSWAVTT